MDLSFLRRVYLTSVWVSGLSAAAVYSRYSPRAGLGLLFGALLSLFLLMSLEWGVRRFVGPETRSAGRLLGLVLLHLTLAGVMLVVAFLLARAGLLSLFWVIPGYALPHAVVGLKLVGRFLTRPAP